MKREAMPVPHRRARITQEMREAILVDWRMGEMSRRDLAHKYNVSKAAVDKVCVGVAQDAKRIVAAGVAYNQMLADESGQIVAAVEDEVAKRAAQIRFFAEATHKNLSVMLEKIDAETTIQDHKTAQTAIKDGKETVLGKEPETVINNTQSVAVHTGVSLAVSAAELRALNDELDAEY